jgi:structure-specific recognition protein 1
MARRNRDTNVIIRETYDNIYLNLSSVSGRCRFADSGMGWKPTGTGDTWTLDKDQIVQAFWSRAAKAYELKIQTRSSGTARLDGFLAEVTSTKQT